MWPFKKKIRQRRLEVRKNIPTQRGALWRRFSAAGGPGGVAVAAALFVVATALVVSPIDSLSYRMGQTEPRVYARVSFDAPNEQRTKEARDRAGNQVPSIYVANRALLAEVEAQLQALPGKVANASDEERTELIEKLGLAGGAKLAVFTKYAEEPAVHRWRAAIVNAMAELHAQVILSPRDVKYESTRLTAMIELSAPGRVGRVDRQYIVATDDPMRLSESLAAVVAPFDKDVRSLIRAYLLNYIGENHPTYTRDVAATEQAIQIARDAVAPETSPYMADSVIFGGGTITPADLIVLRAEHQAYRKWLKNHDPNRDLRTASGRVAMVLLVVAGLAGYIGLYQQRIVRNPLRGIALTVLVSIMLVLAKLMIGVAGWNPYLAAGVTAMVAVVITIAYSRRFALAFGGAMAMLLVIQTRQDLGFMLALLTPVAISVLLLKEIRTRSKVIEVGALAAVAAFAATGVTQLAAGRPFSGYMAVSCGVAAGGVLAMGFIIQGLLPAIERIFNIATAMTLLEWCDANKRLLKRLAMDAPGTFNHSLLLGTLCEAAAETVGGNGLLARVGAYYHDIGKINKPEYFVENQFGSPSKHEKLSPAMSLLIITGHVKDGVEMAKEYNLPPVLHQFIATHHGTTLVQYFYHAATQKADGDRIPEEIEFRYPGPKPQTKEAGILMLADATESSVRAMSEPTPARIEAQAHSVLTERLTDGQLDECDLTLRDAHRIEESLVKSLCGIYHGRIAYPKGDTKPARRSGNHRSTAGA